VKVEEGNQYKLLLTSHGRTRSCP